MKPTLLLFDIDGTILRTNGAGMRAMSAVARRLFGPGFTWEGINASGHLDPLIFAEAAALNGLDNDPRHHAAFHDHYLQELREELQRSHANVQVMPGILDLLGQLRQRAQDRGDVVLGLLTGNYTKAVPIKLIAVGVDPAWFPITAFGDEGRTRPDLVLVAMKKYQALTGQPADPQRVIVIGDTPRDIACAHAHQCQALAVGTGGYKLEELAGADRVVANLADPTPLLQMIDRVSCAE